LHDYFLSYIVNQNAHFKINPKGGGMTKLVLLQLVITAIVLPDTFPYLRALLGFNTKA